MNVVVGWVDSYNNSYQKAPFTEERKKALVERIRKRAYNFTMFDHEYMQYCAPFYDDGKFCVLTKQQFNDVMAEAYKDMPRGRRLIPQDVIEDTPHNGVLYEKKKFYMEGDGGNG
jgi:hypothetical protein